LVLTNHMVAGPGRDVGTCFYQSLSPPDSVLVMAQGNRSSNRWGPGESMKTGSTLYSVEKERWAEWLATPGERRDETKDEMATLLGVTRRTLNNWAKEPTVVAKVQQITGRFVKVQLLPEIIQSLSDQATDPSNPRSVSASKLLIDFMEKRAESAPVDLGELTLEELTAMTEELYDRFAAADESQSA